MEDQNNKPLDLQNNPNAIREGCERMAQDFLPQVKDALEMLLEVKPFQGITAWEKIASFAVSKKTEKRDEIAPNTNITINMIPAERKQRNKLDIPISDAEIIDDKNE